MKKSKAEHCAAGRSGISTRALVLWSIVGLALLGVAVGGAVVWTQTRATCEAVKKHATSRKIVASLEAIEELGGPRRAAFRLGIYLRLPEKWAPHRRWAVECLGFMYDEPGATTARAVLLRLLNDDDVRVRGAALRALGDVVPGLEHATGISGALDDAEESVRLAAIRALDRIRPRPEEPLPGLMRALRDRSAVVRMKAALYVVRRWPEDPEVRRRVVELLKDPQLKKRDAEGDLPAATRHACAVVEAIGRGGKDNAWAVPCLRAFKVGFKSGYWTDVRALLRSHQALWRIRGELRRADLTAIHDLLKQNFHSESTEEREVLAELGVSAAELEKLARDPGDAASASERKFKPRGKLPGPDPEWKVDLKYRSGRTVSFEAVQAPCKPVLEDLGKLTGVKVTVDPQMAPAKANRPITLKMTGASLGLAAEWISKLASLRAEFREDGLWIVDPAKRAPSGPRP